MKIWDHFFRVLGDETPRLNAKQRLSSFTANEWTSHSTACRQGQTKQESSTQTE